MALAAERMDRRTTGWRRLEEAGGSVASWVSTWALESKPLNLLLLIEKIAPPSQNWWESRMRKWVQGHYHSAQYTANLE